MAFDFWYLRALIKRNLFLFSSSVVVTNQVVYKAKLPGLESGMVLLNTVYLVAKLKLTGCAVKLEIPTHI